MTDDCAALNDLRSEGSFDRRTLVDFLKASAIVAAAVALALSLPAPDAPIEGQSEQGVFPFGSALSLRSALPPEPTLSSEAATFSIVEAPLPPTRATLTRHFRPRSRLGPVAETHVVSKARRANSRRAWRSAETPLTVVARAADALAMEIGRGLRQLPVRLSQLFSGRRARSRQ